MVSLSVGTLALQLSPCPCESNESVPVRMDGHLCPAGRMGFKQGDRRRQPQSEKTIDLLAQLFHKLHFIQLAVVPPFDL